MCSYSVIVKVNVPKNHRFGLCNIFKFVIADSFCFKGMKKAFCKHIISAVTFAAHATP